MSVPIVQYRTAITDLYNWGLSSAYGTSNRVLRSDLAEMSDPDYYEKFLKDPVVAHALNMRLHGVAGRKYRIQAGATPGGVPDDPSKQLSSAVEECFQEWQGSHEARRQLAIGVVTGESIAQAQGVRKLMSVGGGPELEWWCPTYLKGFGNFRNRWKPVHTPDPMTGKDSFTLLRELWSVERRAWEEVPPEEEAFLVNCLFESEEARLAQGRGLKTSIFSYLWIKENIVNQLLEWVERFANGMVSVQIDGYQNLVGSPERTNDALAQNWIDVWSKWRSKYILPYGRGQEVKVWETNGQGYQALLETIRYLDDAITSLILGSLRPFGKGEGGTYGQGKVEAESSEGLIQFDRDKVDEDITRDLIGLWLRLNRENIAIMGWDRAKKPRFETSVDPNISPMEALQAAEILHNIGADVRLSDLYQATKLFSKPAPGDEVLAGKDQTAPDPLGGFGGGGFPKDTPATDGEIPNDVKEKLAAGTLTNDEARAVVMRLRAMRKVA